MASPCSKQRPSHYRPRCPCTGALNHVCDGVDRELPCRHGACLVEPSRRRPSRRAAATTVTTPTSSPVFEHREHGTPERVLVGLLPRRRRSPRRRACRGHHALGVALHQAPAQSRAGPVMFRPRLHRAELASTASSPPSPILRHRTPTSRADAAPAVSTMTLPRRPRRATAPSAS